MLNQPQYNNTQEGRQNLSETVATRAITMTFGTNGSAVGQFNSIPFRVKEVRVIASSFDDWNVPVEQFAILWCDLFQTTPVSILGLSTTHTGVGSSNFFQLNGSTGSRIQFNPARDISGQINFRLTYTDFQQTPVIFTTATRTACVILEFVRGE